MLIRKRKREEIPVMTISQETLEIAFEKYSQHRVEKKEESKAYLSMYT